MLILDRTKDQSVHIVVDGREIIVRVTHISPGKCKLGFSAPRDVKILRSELLTRESEPTLDEIESHIQECPLWVDTELYRKSIAAILAELDAAMKPDVDEVAAINALRARLRKMAEQ